MKYSRPMIIAQSKKAGSYAAGCPANNYGLDSSCKRCDRTR